MTNDLDYAIHMYCSMLPNLNGTSHNSDDKRLCKIAYEAFQINTDTDVIKNRLIDELKINDKLSNPTEERLSEFADECISKIRTVQYTMKFLKEFGVLK